MKIRVIYNSSIAKFINAEAITLYPFIFFSGSKDYYINDNYYNKYSYIYRHELEHIYQVRKYGFLTFYFCYFAMFFINMILHRSISEAYWSIPLEIEARQKELVQLKETEIKELELE